MITQTYEHHLELRKDKLCPFKFKECECVYNSVCNWHHNIEILLVTEGCGRIQYGSDDMPIEAHDMILVNSGVLHRVYSETGISFTYVIIDESFCIENGIEMKNRTFEPKFKSESVENTLLSAHARFAAYKDDPSPIRTASMRCAVLALVIEICTNHTVDTDGRPQSHSASEQYIKQALEYLGEHYAEPISLEEVASLCGITKYHLARIFKIYTGQTLFTYVNILRCKKAELCLSDGMTVTEASRECGFESLSYFSRTYKKLIGYSPSSKKGK